MLSFLFNSILSKKSSDLEVYADLPNLSLNGFTVPSDILPTQQKPDLVIINRSEKIISLVELTICFETNFEAANDRKKERYTQLKLDLEDRGYICHLFPLEVGSRGHYQALCNVMNLGPLTVKGLQSTYNSFRFF